MRAAVLVVALCAGCGEDRGQPADLGMAPADDLAMALDLAFVPTGPTKLSETGLYSDIASRTYASGVIPYNVRYPLWSDGADKQRLLYIPPPLQIDTTDMDNWVFPIGTKVWKEFRVNGQLVETRLLHKQAAGRYGWWKIAYVWLPDGSDAIATTTHVANANGTTHDVPAPDECTRCHVNVADVVIGAAAIELSNGGAGSLTQLAQAGLLSSPPSGEFAAPGSGVVQDALGYLHGNCGPCHSSQSLLANKVAMRLRLSVSEMTPEATQLYATTINAMMTHNLNGHPYAVVPGAPDQSQVYYRMSVRDADQMPPVCTKLVDDTGLQSVHDWIAGLMIRDN
jgi:hypothetical protein